MKRFILIWFIIVGVSLSAFSQDSTGTKGDGGRLRALEIAYITKRLNLSPEEAQKFWPIYNKYDEEIHRARQDFRGNKDEIRLEENVLNIRKKYSSEFSSALSPDKVNMFFRSEKE